MKNFFLKNPVLCYFIIIFSLFIPFFHFNNLLNSDFDTAEDIFLLISVSKYSISELFLKSHIYGIYEGYNYRPIIAILTKLLYPSVSPPDPIYYRIIQIILICTSIFGMIKIVDLEKKNPLIFLIFISIYFSIPSLTSAITWWTDIGSLININCFIFFLISIKYKYNDILKTIIILTLFLIAILSKELGIIIGLTSLIYFLNKKKYISSVLVILLMLVYFLLRAHVIGGLLFEDTFYEKIYIFSKLYSVEELNSNFGNFPYLIYCYNIFVSFLTILGISSELFIKLNLIKLGHTLIYFITSLIIIIWYIKNKSLKFNLNNILLLVIFINCIITFKYSTPRALPIASISYILLLILSIDDFLSNKELHKKLFVPFITITFIWVSFSLENIGIRKRQISLLRHQYINFDEIKYDKKISKDIILEIHKQYFGTNDHIQPY